MDVNPLQDDGHKYWMKQISKGATRSGILEYFKRVAERDNNKINNKSGLEDFLDEEGKENRIAIVLKGSALDVLLVNSLIENLKKLYPSHNIYFITNPDLYPLIEDNPGIYKLIPFSPEFENTFFLEGNSSHEGFFDIAFFQLLPLRKM